METPTKPVPTLPSPSTFSKIVSKLYNILPTYKGSIWQLLVASIVYKFTYLYKMIPKLKPNENPYYIFYLPNIDTIINAIPFLLLGALIIVAFFTTFVLYQQVLFYPPPPSPLS